MQPDRVLAVVLVALSAGYLWATLLIDQPPGQYAVVGPQAFPLAIGVGLLICSLAMLQQPRQADRSPPVDWTRLAGCALVFFAYLMFFEIAGYLVATASFITIEARLLGCRSWRRNAIAGVGVTASVYGLLDVLLGMPLPGGWLG